MQTKKPHKEVLEAEDNHHVPSSNASESDHSHGPHKHFTTDKKAKIVKKAAEIKVVAFPFLYSSDEWREVIFRHMMSTNN